MIRRFLATACLVLAMTLVSVVPVLAANYNCGAYGAGAYDSGTVCGASTTSGGGGLVNTGEKVLAFVIPAALILAGTLLLFRARRRSKQTPPLQGPSA